jgi:hypothetical protein
MMNNHAFQQLTRSTWPVLLLVVLMATYAAAAVADETPRKDLVIYDARGNLLKSPRIYDFQATKAETITIEYDCALKVASFKITETERQLRIYEDLTALLKKLVDGKSNAPCMNTGKETYTLKFVRATIKVSALDASGTEVAATTLITGPKEHLALGVDLPVTKAKSLKYDSTSQTLRPQDTNPQLYISANYLFGDVLEKPENLKPLERFELKALVLASRRPLDSYGVGLGYRVGGIKLLGVLDLKGVTVFGGYFVTSADQVTNGTPELNQGKKRGWRAGVSYDLGTGLDWVKF